MADKSGTSSGITLELSSADKQADLQADRISSRPVTTPPPASRATADTSPSSNLAASSNITINFSGTNTANGVQASVGVDQKNTVRSSSSGPPHVGPYSKINVATSEPTRPSDRRVDTVAERDQFSAVALANNDTPQEARHPSKKTSRSLSSTSGSSAQSLTENDDCYRPNHYPPRSDGFVPVDLPQNPSLSYRHEKLRDEMHDLLSRAAQDSWESMIQQVDSDEVIVGVTPVTDRMNRPARNRNRKEYEVGQVRWTYIVESSSDPNLINTRADRLIRTGEGLMLAKWRPTVVVSVEPQHCIVAELGRRRRQYLDKLSLSDLLGRCGVALDRDYGDDYDTLSEDHVFFRSIARPLEIGGYERGAFRLEGWSVVQPGRLRTQGFDNLCVPCGWLTAESTTRLLAMQAQLPNLRAIVESRYSEEFLRKPLPYMLAPEHRAALSYIKHEFRQLVSPSVDNTSTSSGQATNQQGGRAEIRALLEKSRQDIAPLPTSGPTSANGLPSAFIEPSEFVFSIPGNGHGVPPSFIIDKAKDVSHLQWKTAKAARVQNESLLYRADKKYKAVEANPRSSAVERKDLKRKRDDVEVELEVAQLQELGYKKLHMDLGSYQPSQHGGQGRDVKLCTTLTGKFNKVQIDSRKVKNHRPRQRN